MPEFKILGNIIDHMESTGSTYKAIRIVIDEELVNVINKNYQANYTLSELLKATDKCLAHEWLTHTTLGAGYGDLQITPKGVGVVRSKRKSDELNASKSWLKKLSDSIEVHKGILIFLASSITLATFILKLLGKI